MTCRLFATWTTLEEGGQSFSEGLTEALILIVVGENTKGVSGSGSVTASESYGWAMNRYICKFV